MIPARLIRSVPDRTTDDVERYWQHACDLHLRWSHCTFRDPINPAAFPLTSPSWPLCSSGAQLAGLVRLEALWVYGGVWLDSDVEVFKSFDPLRSCAMFAAWEDENVVPDAVMGATAGHPAIRACIDLALVRLQSSSTDWRTGNGAWATGPGVTTTILPTFDGVTLFGPELVYPVHYTRKADLDSFEPGPDNYAMHRWHGSWLA